MFSKIRLLSTDFDGTLVAHGDDPVLDPGCVEHIRQLQAGGVVWAINTGRSVQLLESGLTDFAFPIHPDFILTSERDVFRPSTNGGKWEPFGDWNERVAREHAELFTSAEAVLAEVVDFVNQKTKARLLYHTAGLEGLVARTRRSSTASPNSSIEPGKNSRSFITSATRFTCAFATLDYHKGAALAELSRLLEIPRGEVFAAGDHHNDISMLDGRFAQYPACPANAIPEVKEAVLVSRRLCSFEKARRGRSRSAAALAGA